MDTAAETPHLLDVAHLSVSVLADAGRSDVIHDVSFRMRAHEVLTLLGESGSGKTILCRAVTRLFPAASTVKVEGSVTFDGRPLFTLTGHELADIRRTRIRYVFQEPMQSLNPVATIGKQMRLASDLSADDDTFLHDTLRLVGLDNGEEVLGSYPHALSIGMAQRVCIAMAVMSSPALLIADEPTSAVDASMRRKLLDLLMAIEQSRAMALIMITHDLEVARWYGDRIAVMYGGRIVEHAERRALFETPLHPYTRLLINAHSPDQNIAAPLRMTKDPVGGDPPLRGCVFEPRCPFAKAKCKEAEPAPETPTDGREVRCFYWK
jgi:peptide/nickel transport system ATP-binding protein